MSRVDRHATSLTVRIAAALRHRDQAELRALRPVIWALSSRVITREEIAGLTLAQALDVVAKRQGRRRWADRR